MGKVDKRIQEYLENPLLLSVDAGLEIGEKLRAPIRCETKKEAKNLIVNIWLKQYEQYGYGRYALIHKEQNKET